MWPGGKQGQRIELLDTACRVKGISTQDWDDACVRDDLKEDQQMRRVYYVACTRARKHLILVDARSLWAAGANYQFLRPIQALSARGESDGWMDRIPEWSAPPAAEEAGFVPDKLVGVLPDWKTVAGIPSMEIIHPSQKDEDRSDLDFDKREDRSSQRPRVEPLHGALIYGNWWHETMFRADWSAKDVADQLKSEVNRLPSSELRERGDCEIRKFLASEFFGELTATGVRFHRELTYARMHGRNAIEDGKIDLLYRLGDAWTMLDWKTDRVSNREEARISAGEKYGSQIQVYIEALRDFNVPVESGRVYFTALGEMIESSSSSAAKG
jgi:ATP-dependent exoDNAse (exonuclease V) beta subunit